MTEQPMPEELRVLDALWSGALAVQDQANQVIDRARTVAVLAAGHQQLVTVLWQLIHAHPPDQSGATCLGCGQPWMCRTRQTIAAGLLPPAGAPPPPPAPAPAQDVNQL